MIANKKQLSTLFWGTVLFWIISYAVISPEFGGIDTFIFKDAGANLALGNGFVTSNLPGSLDAESHLYAGYPPLYSLVFGIYSKIFGVGSYQNTYFNLLISLFCAILWFKLFIILFQFNTASRYRWIILGVLVSLLPTSLLGSGRDRPEPLSFGILLMTVLLSIHTFEDFQSSKKRWSWIFFWVGINAMISPFGGILNLLSMTLLHRSHLLKLKEPKWLFSAIFWTAVPTAVVCTTYAFLDPSAFERFLIHSAKGGSGLGVVLGIIKEGGMSAYFGTLLSPLTNPNLQTRGIVFSFLLVSFIFPAYLLLKFRVHKNHEYLVFGLALFAISAFPFLVFPNQSNYMAYTRNAILALITYFAIQNERLSKTLIQTLAGVFLVIFGSIVFLFGRDLAIRATNHASYNRAIEQRDKLVTHTSIGVWPNLYFIYKPKFEVRDLYWTPPEILKKSQVFATSYAESGDLYKPIAPQGLRTPANSPISQPALPQPNKVFGYQISKSSNTWEALIYENPEFLP